MLLGGKKHKKEKNMQPEEYAILDFSKDDIEEVTGVKIEDMENNNLDGYSDLQISVMVLARVLDMGDWAMISNTMEPATGLKFSTPADFIQYMLKILSKEDFDMWAKKMAIIKLGMVKRFNPSTSSADEA